MKIRNGFVSNSSSSSFVLKTYMLTKDQRETMLSFAERIYNGSYGDGPMNFCGIEFKREAKHAVEAGAYLIMEIDYDDTDAMASLLNKLGIDPVCYKWGDEYCPEIKEPDLDALGWLVRRMPDSIKRKLLLETDIPSEVSDFLINNLRPDKGELP